MSSELTAVVTKEVQALQEKGALEEVPPGTPGFLSPLFVVPKKNGKMRPVADLRELNQFVQYHHFKMEGIATLRELLIKNDFMVKVDLTDAYLSMPVHPTLRRFLTVQWQSRQYQFAAVPFGLASAPRQFTKLLHPVITCLRQQGVRLVVYLDDILIMAGSYQEALQHVANLIHLLLALGFQVNFSKSELQPVQVVEFLGFQVSSIAMTLELPTDKVHRTLTTCRSLIAQRQSTVRRLASILGLLSSAAPAILPTNLHLSGLESVRASALRRQVPWEETVPLCAAALEDLSWWLQHLEEVNGRSIPLPVPDLVMQTDAASTVGWGAVCGHRHASGLWTVAEKHIHINCLELRAAFFGLQSLAKDLRSAHVIIEIDNQAAVWCINKMRSTTSPELNSEAQQLWQWCLEKDITIRAEYRPGELNVEADFWSRQTGAAQWILHREVFQRLANQLAFPLEVDLFASRTAAQLPRFVSWKPDPHSWRTDAPSFTWSDLNAYLFPPLCLLTRCLRKIQREEVAQCVLVAPMWRGAPWFPLLLSLCVDQPIMLPHHPRLLMNEQGDVHPLVEARQLRLVAWPLSGVYGSINNFQQTCRRSSVLLGVEERGNITTQLGHCGVSGAVNGRLIPFRHLPA
ncbi:uncharacterized protein LOC135826738 [Sycon ciliatum]|uniref:uncharacterized protein LOC135826738 n=1 Tax=Sycon ciliatum TaxID=27933 RepID=UPI0031F621E2